VWVFESSAQDKYEPRRDNVSGGWRKLHNEEPEFVLFAEYN
jgi:hypothetical protein